MPAVLPMLWPRYRPFVLDALSTGERSYDERDVLALLLAAQWAMLAAERDGKVIAICIVEVLNYPRQRKLLARYVAGKDALDCLVAAVPVLEETARALKCQAIEAYARKGWARLLPDWSKRFIVLHKDVEPCAH